MKESNICSKCGGTEIYEGDLVRATIGFLEFTTTISKQKYEIPVHAHICMDCGIVELKGKSSIVATIKKAINK